ncbi:MAG: bifunctional 2-C-methyl-D-erythritol 4-phosphate cytidylyltransferase/2-C-methyl-D-erythritol 2,4-cyclodiphosphate synthase [Arenibacterium sp.]
MTTAALIVAAGQGNRAGGEIAKQWQKLGTRMMIEHTIDAFRAVPEVGLISVVVAADAPSQAADLREAGLIVATGGAERSDSVLNGLLALAEYAPKRVLIHDAARPCVSAALISRVIAALDGTHAAAPALAVTDALWTGDMGRVTGTRDRSGLFRAQTPQGFDFKTILAAHRAHKGNAADDVEVARAAGIEVAIVPGEADNLKVTLPPDFERAARILGEGDMGLAVRMGNGFDVHRFGAGDHVTLCGVDIPFERGLQGHSDADVGLHAITDAIYGALAEGDIGQHFPPSDPQWKGAESHIFLRHAVKLAREKGFAIGNVDCTLICEFPKIGPHATAMRSAVADIMGCSINQVSVKATTSERLGFTGRGEGIAAQASAVLVAL